MPQHPRSPVVLVVEDETLVRANVVEALEDDGFEVLEAGSGPEALSIVAGGAAVDVLFTDVNMPGRPDGIELAVTLCERLPKLAVIISSGRPLPAGPVPCDGQFLPKPYVLAEIGRMIRRLAA